MPSHPLRRRLVGKWESEHSSNRNAQASGESDGPEAETEHGPDKSSPAADEQEHVCGVDLFRYESEREDCGVRFVRSPLGGGVDKAECVRLLAAHHRPVVRDSRDYEGRRRDDQIGDGIGKDARLSDSDRANAPGVSAAHRAFGRRILCDFGSHARAVCANRGGGEEAASPLLLDRAHGDLRRSEAQGGKESSAEGREHHHFHAGSSVGPRAAHRVAVAEPRAHAGAGRGGPAAGHGLRAAAA